MEALVFQYLALALALALVLALALAVAVAQIMGSRVVYRYQRHKKRWSFVAHFSGSDAYSSSPSARPISVLSTCRRIQYFASTGTRAPIVTPTMIREGKCREESQSQRLLSAKHNDLDYELEM